MTIDSAMHEATSQMTEYRQPSDTYCKVPTNQQVVKRYKIQI